MMPSEDEPDEVAAVVTAWGRIEKWLKAHAPMSHTALRPPATSGQLEAAEQETGFALPAELKALWLLHDGTHEMPAHLAAFGFMVGYQEMLALPLPLRLRWLWDMGAGGALYPEPPDPAAFEREPRYAEMLGQDLPEQILWLWEHSDLPLPALLVGDEEAEEDLNTFLHGEGLLRIDRAMSLRSMMVSTGEWPGAWVPFTADNPDDPYAGSFLDTGTGMVGRWGLMDVPSPGEETLAGFLVSAADALG
ncbi:hypothetical protein [Streptomyces atratus]|uniref:Knr4/Smi1-like domain-containing protein n=1 Tax=Streptomyces atratus TaxID=1893 RepID=A0A1K2A3P4_STRAR|nr:hypothetical protein [Streptomyces atratus]SFX80984.1 hypothetical protein SAMN02787144_1006256 [Streptomyces atratus]